MNLPLHDLEPRDFEELCFWLIRASEIDELGHANVYGRSGQDQHGIDAYSYHHGRNEYRVYQCKRYQKYTPGDLRKAIAELEAGPQASAGTPDWLRQATTFVLCISVPFANDKNLTDERDAQTKILKARKLEFVIWDASEISKRLQEQPIIVEEFFGIKGVEEYCPQTIGEPYLRGVKARALLNIPRPNWNPKASVAPSALLKARNRIVSLEGRDTELKAYRAWTNDPNPWDVQLITGAGGTGKTRLMLEFCTELKAKGWNAGFMDTNIKRTTDQDQWRDLLEQSRPVFAVVDYAEGRQEELIAFLKALQDGLSEREIPVRLMLLARGLGEWYDRLHEQDGAQDLLPSKTELENPNQPKNRKLDPPSTLEQPEAAKAEFRRALEVFAPARGKTAPSHSIDLSSDLFKRVLFVHMAALLVVEGETLQNPTQAELLGAVLAVERKYWRSRMNKEQENLIPALERTMTLVTLGYPVQSLEAANALLDLDRNLSALDVNGKDQISNLLHDTYPGPAYINPIEPDLLAEHLVLSLIGDVNPDHKGRERLIEIAFGKKIPEGDPIGKNDKENVDIGIAIPILVRIERSYPNSKLVQNILEGREYNRSLNFWYIIYKTAYLVKESQDFIIETYEEIANQQKKLNLALENYIKADEDIVDFFCEYLSSIILEKNLLSQENNQSIIQPALKESLIAKNKEITQSSLENEFQFAIEQGLAHFMEEEPKIYKLIIEIKAGERDLDVLTASLDDDYAALVHRILEIIQEHTP